MGKEEWKKPTFVSLAFLQLVTLVFVIIALAFVVSEKKKSQPQSIIRNISLGNLSPQEEKLVEASDCVLQNTDGFPYWTCKFPTHWTFFPEDFLQPDTRQVFLAGNYGIGTEKTNSWIVSWITIDSVFRSAASSNSHGFVSFKIDAEDKPLVVSAAGFFFPALKFKCLQENSAETAVAKLSSCVTNQSLFFITFGQQAITKFVF